MSWLKRPHRLFEGIDFISVSMGTWSLLYANAYVSTWSFKILRVWVQFSWTQRKTLQWIGFRPIILQSVELNVKIISSLKPWRIISELFSTGAGLVAASMIAIVPGYISRSVAGSYDNEGIAIFCMLFTYYLWIKSVKTGAIYWSTLCALAYFYMVSAILL